MGYRFVLKQISYPRSVTAGHLMPVQMWWLNTGIAPLYREHWLALELRSARGAAVPRVPVDVRTFLPDDAVFDGMLYVPEGLAPGAYRLRVAMLDPRTQAPAIRLANAGRQSDGWYDLGEIRVDQARGERGSLLRALALVLNGRAGSERSGERNEDVIEASDLVHINNDEKFVRQAACQLVSSDARLVFLGDAAAPAARGSEPVGLNAAGVA